MPVVSLRAARTRRRGALNNLRAITASGMPVGQKSNAELIRRLDQPWQPRSFVYYNLVPEVWYAGGFYSRHMSKIELRIEQYAEDEDGDFAWRPVENADDPVITFFDRLQDERGGRSAMLGTYGRLRFLNGECYLVCLDPNTDDEKWEVLSKREFRPTQDGKGYERFRYEGAQAERLLEASDDAESWEQVPSSAWVWRLWRRHPEFSMQADSPMRAVQDVCEELLLLTLAVRARARSRIARSGLLLLPNEISPPPQTQFEADDALEDDFLNKLAEHLEAPLQSEGASASVVPLLVRGPAEFLDKLRQLTLSTEGAYPESQLRTEAIERLANGLDMPREALLGTAGVNHWNAWQIDQQTWEAHVQPVVEEFCEELSAVVLRPSLEKSSMLPAEARRYRVWYDAVKIVNHPDRGKDAQDTYDRGELGGHALRAAKGFDESDGPSLEERARYIGIRVRDSGLAWYGKPTLKPGATEEAGEPLPTDDPDSTSGETAPQDGGTGNDVQVGPPAAPAGNEATARLLGAAEAALLQCRKTAGSRIIQRMPRSARARYAKTPKHLLYCEIPGGELDTYLSSANGDARPEALVRGGAEALGQCLAAWGYPPERVDAISRFVEEHAAATLGEAEPAAFAPILFNL